MQQFTGRHFLFVMLGFFGVIIGVNLIMAFYASSSWSGFVVRNSYIAGLEMNERLEAYRRQAATGWHVELSGGGGTLHLALTDAEGAPLPVLGGTAGFRRPVGDAEDVTLLLTPSQHGGLEAPFGIRDGAWIVDIELDAGQESPWTESRRIHVRNGVVQ